MASLVGKTFVRQQDANGTDDGPSKDATLAKPTSGLKTQWKVIAESTGIQTTKERLKSYWTTLGVVSALLLALTYPSITNPVVNKQNNGFGPTSVDDPLYVGYVILNTVGVIFSLMVVVMSVVLLAEVDLVVTEDDLGAFIDRYQVLFQAMTVVFGTSVLIIIACIALLAFFYFSRGTAIAVTAIAVGGTLTVAMVSAWLATWTRSRLNVHVSTANERARAVLRKLRTGAAGGTSSGVGGGTAVPGGGGSGGGSGGSARVVPLPGPSAGTGAGGVRQQPGI